MLGAIAIINTNSDLNGVCCLCDFDQICKYFVKNLYHVYDDNSRQFTSKVIGLAMKANGQVGALLDSNEYTLKAVYIDKNKKPHISTLSIGDTVWSKNIETYNELRLNDNSRIKQVRMFR